MSRRATIPILVAVGLLLAVAGRAQDGDQVLQIHPAVRLVVDDAGDLFFQVKAAKGDGWSHLAERFATAKEDWRALKALNGDGEPAVDRYYRVPYALLSNSYKFLGIAALFPQDVVGPQGWQHQVGTARLPIEEESLYRLAFWFTGDGENFRQLLGANALLDPTLQPGQEIVIPLDLLHQAFRHAFTDEEAEKAGLTFGRDDKGDYAGYRLRRGEAIYSAVILRLTDGVDADEVDDMVKRLASRSGIRDVKDIPAGFLIRIPLEDLADRFLPRNDPRRVEMEMTRLLASQYQATVRSQDLAGITVILDPGHGGVDIGTRQNGVWEDDTAYDISLRLRRALLERTGASVRMTVMDRSQKLEPHDGAFSRIDRDEVILTHPQHLATDSASRAVGVNLRAFLANSIYRAERQKGTDDEKVVFISVHADALHSSVRGAMVYVPGERYRRGRYGASGSTYQKYREVREKPYVTFSRPERLRSEGLSRQLARSMVASFHGHDLEVHPDQPIRDHVVRNRRSWVPAVLRGNEVPIKVLLEVANIANQQDAKLLTRPEHRERLAEALLDALLSFYQGR